MSNSIATQLILSAKEQLDKAIASATSKITLLENLLAQGLGEEQLKQVIQEKIDDGTIGTAIFGQENIVNTKNVTDGAITNSKISTTINNLATNITASKTIDTTTGELIDSTTGYVTDFIQVRNEDGTPIYNNLYINKWKNSLLWVGYGKNKTTVVKSGLGGSTTGKIQRKITVGSFSNVYYVRIVGYTDLCLSNEFIVTDTEYKNIDWLKLDEDNFTSALPSYLCNSNICTVRTDDSIDINVKSVDGDTASSTISLSTNKTVMAYVDNVSTQIASSKYTLTKTLSTGNYALIYDINLKRLQIVSITELSNYKYSILCYLYIYKQSSVNCYLLGNDSKINVTWTHTVTDSSTDMDYEVSEKITDSNLDSVFTHDIYPTSQNWLEINRVGINKYATPYPFIFNSTIKAQGGMIVAENGDCSMYNGLASGHGGHLFQGWAQNSQYRCTILNDNRMADNLPVTVLQNWITKGLKENTDCAYGWIHIGSDDFKIIDEVIDTSDSKVGIYIHPKVSIVGTPLVLEPKPLLTTMPQGYQVDSKGDYVIDETTGKRIKLAQESIDGKNVLQVNESNELCFHSATDNKWYKVNMTEITE